MFRNPGGIPGKTLCKITCPDLMEAIHRWKSGLLLGGKAQTLNSTRQITAKCFCACRKCMPEKEKKKKMQEVRGLLHSEVY